MEFLDLQMQKFSPKLRDDLKIGTLESNQLATTISREVEDLPENVKVKVRESTPISLKDRLDELVAFQSWMDIANSGVKHPAINRAQVITQNYVCFIYLSESCFKILKREMPSESTTRKCCTFLTDIPVRAFRNAVAHANWKYKEDFSGLEFWARKGDSANEPLTHFEVTQNELGFWQSIARCTAYAAFSTLH